MGLHIFLTIEICPKGVIAAICKLLLMEIGKKILET